MIQSPIENSCVLLREKLDAKNYEKLMAIKNPHLHAFIADGIALCKPKSVFVATDAPADVKYIREMAIKNREETPLKIKGHTVHFDGIKDQGRDPENTKYLVPKGEKFGKNLAQCDRDQGITEVRGFLDGSMKDREMIVRFFCLGPVNSEFAISCVQMTDSFYVAHSEDILYRTGYEQFKRIGDTDDFFKVVHSSGRVDDKMISIDVDKRRIYQDYTTQTVYTVNCQYAGNTVGLKKLSLRMAIRKADREGWLAEHMFIMAVHGPKGRKSYFTGAFPSACGKTSTSMIKGEKIIGDDLAYLRIRDGKLYAANVECGIFGIIQDVNAEDDPAIWDVLMNPGEVIFSNVLVTDGTPYWLGDGREIPEKGYNYSGEWFKGKTNAKGALLDHSHKNARYTISINDLANRDEKADDPAGCLVSGIIYGGRDSDTWVPVVESFDWAHGVVTMGASLESETTAATIGQEGVRTFQPMSNIEFLSMPVGDYVNNHLKFPKGLKEVPKIFAVNYFQKDENGKYMTGMNDKNVWVKWMELRTHNEVGALKTPSGFIPKYKDLKPLFKSVLNKDYAEADYTKQFSIRTPQQIKKLDRIINTYETKVGDVPPVILQILKDQRERLVALQKAKGDVVPPSAFSDQ